MDSLERHKERNDFQVCLWRWRGKVGSKGNQRCEDESMWVVYCIIGKWGCGFVLFC